MACSSNRCPKLQFQYIQVLAGTYSVESTTYHPLKREGEIMNASVLENLILLVEQIIGTYHTIAVAVTVALTFAQRKHC
jgi:hypothetical protein